MGNLTYCKVSDNTCLAKKKNECMKEESRKMLFVIKQFQSNGDLIGLLKQ